MVWPKSSSHWGSNLGTQHEKKITIQLTYYSTTHFNVLNMMVGLLWYDFVGNEGICIILKIKTVCTSVLRELYSLKQVSTFTIWFTTFPLYIYSKTLNTILFLILLMSNNLVKIQSCPSWTHWCLILLSHKSCILLYIEIFIIVSITFWVPSI